MCAYDLLYPDAVVILASLSLATRGDKQTERGPISEAIEIGSDTMRMRIVAHQNTFERRDEAVTRLECLTALTASDGETRSLLKLRCLLLLPADAGN